MPDWSKMFATPGSTAKKSSGKKSSQNSRKKVSQTRDAFNSSGGFRIGRNTAKKRGSKKSY